MFYALGWLFLLLLIGLWSLGGWAVNTLARVGISNGLNCR
jgi:hypothetical protein